MSGAIYSVCKTGDFIKYDCKYVPAMYFWLFFLWFGLAESLFSTDAFNRLKTMYVSININIIPIIIIIIAAISESKDCQT